jgi:CheY-like chemotaxis protein
MQDSRPILLVDDDDIDAMTAQRAFDDLGITNEVIHKVDGAEALEYLRDEHNEMPCVILLDLNMPKMDGLEFLKIVKNEESLKMIPVVILTTSEAQRSIAASFEFNVAGYIVKAVDYTRFLETMRTILAYWTLSRLPV